MRHELDPIRHAPLPDSFERTAAWLREAPAPEPRPRRTPVTVLAALLVVVAACSWPVNVLVPVGSVVEAVSADRVGLEHPALRLLDRLDAQHRVELEPVDAAWQAGTVMRFAFVGHPEARAAQRWADSLAAVPGVQTLRVVRLDATERDLLGLAAVRRVLGRPRALSDAAVRAELDRAFAHLGPAAAQPPEGVRVVRLAEGVVLRLAASVRIGSDSAGTVRIEARSLGVEGVGSPGHLGGPADEALGSVLDSVLAALRTADSTIHFSAHGTREIRFPEGVVLRMDAHADRLRTPGATGAGMGRVDTATNGARVIVLSRVLRADTLGPLVLPPGFHIDTLHVTPDSLRPDRPR